MTMRDSQMKKNLAASQSSQKGKPVTLKDRMPTHSSFSQQGNDGLPNQKQRQINPLHGLMPVDNYINQTQTGRDGNVYLVSVHQNQSAKNSKKNLNINEKMSNQMGEQNYGPKAKRDSTLRQQIGDVLSQVSQAKTLDEKQFFDQYVSASKQASSLHSRHSSNHVSTLKSNTKHS